MSMTEAEIHEMPAGKQMEELIAAEFFGYKKVLRFKPEMGALVQFWQDEDSLICSKYTLPKYSREISDAWLIINRIVGRTKRRPIIRRGHTHWYCDLDFGLVAQGDSPAHAIGRAALLLALECPNIKS